MMAVDSPDYVLSSDWQLDAKPEELSDIVLDPEIIHRWCPRIFMDAKVIERGRADGLGMKVRVHTKGFLPHCFFFEGQIVDLIRHRYMKIAVTGDFEGVANMSVAPNHDGTCHAKFQWTISIRHRYVRWFVKLLYYVFVLNHKWAINMSRWLLQEEVYRRRKASNGFTAARATFPHNLAIYRTWQRQRAEQRGDF